MQKDMCLKLRIKNNLLYSAYSFFAKKSIKEIYKGAVEKSLFTLELPFGYVLYRYWKKKFEKQIKNMIYNSKMLIYNKIYFQKKA